MASGQSESTDELVEAVRQAFRSGLDAKVLRTLPSLLGLRCVQIRCTGESPAAEVAALRALLDDVIDDLDSNQAEALRSFAEPGCPTPMEREDRASGYLRRRQATADGWRRGRHEPLERGARRNRLFRELYREATERVRQFDAAAWLDSEIGGGRGPSGPTLLERELARAHESGRRMWWEDEGAAEWFGPLCAFWSKTSGPYSADSFRYVDTSTVLDSKSFNVTPAVDAPGPKAVLAAVEGFRTDAPERLLYCHQTNWGLVTDEVESHTAEFLALRPSLSIFGIEGERPCPGIICVHTLAVTSDDWILLCLRSSSQHYHPNTWSTSFEEQSRVWPDARHPGEPIDQTVRDTVERCASEELYPGVEVGAAQCLALGRLYCPLESSIDMGYFVLVAARLEAELADVWQGLSQPKSRRGTPDRAEHVGWMACRFPEWSQVSAFIDSTTTDSETRISPQRLRDLEPAAELNLYAGSHQRIEDPRGYPWMPSSPPRLLLGAEWLENATGQ